MCESPKGTDVHSDTREKFAHKTTERALLNNANGNIHCNGIKSHPVFELDEKLNSQCFSLNLLTEHELVIINSHNELFSVFFSID